MRKPSLLDAFCGAGGATRGYQQAGFHVTGVDHKAMPRYVGDAFHQGDALEYIREHGHEYDAIHASPPCHDHSTLASLSGQDGTGWLLAATRDLLLRSGRPWVIENVPGSPMRRDLVLCGEMFGLRTYRHRWFELSFFALSPAHPPHVVRTSSKKRRACWDAGLHVSVTGDVGSYVGAQAMGIGWMTGNELSQAIPPAYTEHIGRYLLIALSFPAATPYYDPHTDGPVPTLTPHRRPPVTAPGYTADDMAAQASAWFEAAHALRSGDKEEALRRLYPPMPDDHIIPMTCALCVVGVELTAAVMRRNVGAEVGEPIGVDVLAMAGTEPTAVTRLVCDLIRQAAGTTPGEADVGKRVVEWITPKGAPLDVVANRSALLLAELLPLFAALSQEVGA